MKRMRSFVCFLCLFLFLAVLRICAAETEPESVPETQAETQMTDVPPAGDPAQDPGQEPEQNHGQDPAQDPGQNTGQDPVQDSGAGGSLQDAVETSVSETVSETLSGQETGNETGALQTVPGSETDPETEVCEESESEPVEDLDPMFGLRVGEEITISVDMLSDGGTDMLMAAASSDTVKVKVLDVFYYDHAGLGDGTGMYTNKYQVTFNGIKAIAYCLEPAKANPKMSDHFTILKYSDGKAVARILYYAQADAAHDGYFAVKHPDYSEEKRFIITHMAAAKAAGSSSWDKHASSGAKKAANALISYAESMPSIQDPEISFSPSEVTASLQGNVLRTGTVTLLGSEGNTAQVTVPSGITLTNQTAASRSGTGTVTVNAGDSFTLSCSSIVQNNPVKITAVGKQNRDYSAYKIKTDSDTQNLGLIFGEGITGENNATLTATFAPHILIRPCKTDSETGHGLQGAVFGLYAAADMTETGGKAWKKDELIESAVTGTDGKAQFTHSVTAGLNYYVKEDRAPAGYLCDTSQRMPVVLRADQGSAVQQTAEKIFTNKPVRGEIRLRKVDRDYGSIPEQAGTEGEETESGDSDISRAQGDAVLEGAVYSLYAKEDILHPDQSGKILYPAGTEVASSGTDSLGNILWTDLPLGKYYVKEITPPEGYNLDETEYEVNLAGTDDRTELAVADLTVTEQVIRQPFKLIKYSEKEGADPLQLAGAGFRAWLVSSLKKDGDSYSTEGVQPVALCADGTAELFTDEKGEAVSVPLPYGTYLVRETTVPADHLPVEEFLVRITEDSPDKPQSIGTLSDRKVQGRIRILKKGPMLTGYRGGTFIFETRGLAGAVFRVTAAEEILRTDAGGYENGEQTVLYRKGQAVTVMTTDSSGEALSEPLPLGKYNIQETTAPYGTVLVPDTFEAELKADGETPVVTDDLEIEDPRQEIEICAVKCSSGLKQIPLKGAEFTLYARDNIYAAGEDGASHGQLLVKAGTALGKAESGKDGRAVFQMDLPHARYYVKETKAPAGYQLSTKQYDCDCSYTDQKQETVRISLKIRDEPVRKESGPHSGVPGTGDRTPLLLLLLGCAGAMAVIIVCLAAAVLRRKH